MSARERRETYVITLRPEPHTDPIRNLRRGLKYLLRVCHLRAVRVEEYPAAHAVEPVASCKPSWKPPRISIPTGEACISGVSRRCCGSAVRMMMALLPKWLRLLPVG
jgi:hypothetical protein